MNSVNTNVNLNNLNRFKSELMVDIHSINDSQYRELFEQLLKYIDCKFELIETRFKEEYQKIPTRLK